MSGSQATEPLFEQIALIGLGLIGSSLARAIREKGLARHLTVFDQSAAVIETGTRLELADRLSTDPGEVIPGADLVIFAVPVGANAAVAAAIAPYLNENALVSDVGSVKERVVRDLTATLPHPARLVPGHPIAGTEHSGPEAGFASLFQNRWAILTPLPETEPSALARVRALWEAVGSQVAIMPPADHDRVLAITSHLPHLIAYTIVGTATTLAEDTKTDVIKYSASGFRDFTRIAASDPVMWRDIFLSNREAVLEMLQRFQEDLTALQRAIRFGEGESLQDHFTRTRAIRRKVIDARQA